MLFLLLFWPIFMRFFLLTFKQLMMSSTESGTKRSFSKNAQALVFYLSILLFKGARERDRETETETDSGVGKGPLPFFRLCTGTSRGVSPRGKDRYPTGGETPSIS